MSFEHCPAVIVVFAMRGCPACEEFKPRLENQVRRWQSYGHRLVFGDKGQSFAEDEIPILLLDAQSADPQINKVADELAVVGLPTTVLFRRYEHPVKYEGVVGDQQLYDILRAAVEA